MPKFKVGQTVYSGRGKHQKKMVVARVIKNPLIPIHQYSFEAPHDGFACGEQSIRATPDGEDLRLRDCFVDDGEVEARVNTLASAMRQPIDFEAYGLGRVFESCGLFFKPDLKLVEWLRDYANGRTIIDVGSGQGHLVRMLKMVKGKVVGLEPTINKEVWTKFRATRSHNDGLDDINEILPWTIQEAENFINKLGGENAMLVFARPCHSDFVEQGIYNMPEGMEALYITVPENLELHNDLGVFEKDAILLDHEGQSEDNEVIYSIKK